MKNVTVSQSCGKWYISIRQKSGIHSGSPFINGRAWTLVWANLPRCQMAQSLSL
ncbi:hypothetical protein ACNKHL_09985 [Shigella flexneri]